MKTIQLFLSSMLCILMLNMDSHAEDIDLYSGLGSSAGKPNVLIVFDNAANFSSNAAGSSCVIDGVATALSGTVGGIEQCAFYNVINSLPNDVVNVGMMVYNANNIRDINNANCGGSNGGCLVIPLTTINAANKASLLTWIKSWVTTGGAGNGYIKAAGEAIGATMQEAWAYYSGGTGLSGRSYAGIKPTAGCQQNFVIFIGNSYGAAGSPGDGGTVSPKSALEGAPGVTAAQTTPLTSTYNTSCGSYTFPSSTSTHENGGYYADEWARYMFQHDLYSTVNESQRITTYTIGLLGASCQAEYASLLTSMANVGGGKYYATSDYDSITQALLKILNEVQAVNSVFSSSSLPVSVNAQGTYLNQIYMGMFRPDATGSPRWVGNLKQYRFVATRHPTTNLIQLSLGDSLAENAISSSGTGFITANAISYWTCADTNATANSYPSTSLTAAQQATLTTNGQYCGGLGGGFWKNDIQGSGGAYDLPDGELVEKGGAAQMMRNALLYADYSTAAGTSTNPRKLYTYCPSGAGCNAALSHSSNAFATSNADITAIMFGASSSVRVSSIVRTGTTALVTTTGNHGFADGSSVTISGATQSEYNVTQNVTVNSPTTFTLTGLPDYPTTPSVGVYTASLHNSASQAISTITRYSNSSSAAGTNSVTATVTTAAAHGYSTGNSVIISGASPSDYNGVKTITVTGDRTFTYPITVYPYTGATNTYQAVVHPYSRTLSSITKSGSTATATTSSAHGFHTGQSVTISGSGQATYEGTKTITVINTTQFTFGGVTGNPGTITVGASVSPSTTPVALSGVNRTGTTVSATANMSFSPATAFVAGDTLDITVSSGSSVNEGAYVGTFTLASCSNWGSGSTCTYPITVTPDTSASGTMSVAISTTPVSIAAGKITRSGSTVTVSNVANTFNHGDSIDISTSGTVYSTESAYTGTWTISCPVSCSTAFTFGPVTVTPATPATGASISAYQGSTPPDRDTLINWIRGQDNFGDEKSPGGSVTVRPSLHGDVLHSRPVVINYGGTIGVVAFYGANDGVYRAVNANQANPTGSALPIPGSELWGFIPTDFFPKLNRQRTNSPVLKLPSTPAGIVPTPMRKDYFADGSTGVYQKFNADMTTNTAYIYFTLRRGGRTLYALNVTDPTNPQYLWKIDSNMTDFAELGQTWSTPKVTLVDGYANPVLIFGAGYDTAEDNEPPSADTMGRGIYIVDAVTGAMVWRATYQPSGATSCAGNSTQASCLVSGMNYSIPSDITLVDKNADGKTDRLYATDVGGNIWRIDLTPTSEHKTPEYWQVTKFAALGCSSGPCSAGTTPRKFFYPVDVVPAGDYDAIMAGQGDREHPLFTDAAADIRNRIYMLQDKNVGNDGSKEPSNPELDFIAITRGKLFDATSTTYSLGAEASDGTTPNKGYYKRLGDGEKMVNAPLTVAGYTYFGTNQPTSAAEGTCANLGIARGYKLNPFTGETSYTTFDGGGLPPSPVTGVVTITVEGENQPVQVPFLIGGGDDPETNPVCLSASCAEKPKVTLPTARTRTYWYQEVD